MTQATPTDEPAAGQKQAEGSSLSPFRFAAFSVLWIATVVSNIGSWMQNAAAGWLMTSLDPDPLTVAMVQVASSLPMFLPALPAGALADILDRRRLLIAVQVLVTALVGGFGLLIRFGHVTAEALLVFAFLAGSAAALIMPAWQSIVPQLVPRAHLQPAVALNSVGLNASRAVGPALAGLIIAAWGVAAPFWLNALSTLGVIAALWWGRPAADDLPHVLPHERFGGAMRAGLRHARHNRELRATLIRAAGFFVFASAYWALLPLVARNQVAGGPELYGLLLGTIGAGAVGGAFVLPLLKRWLGADGLMTTGSAGTAVAMLLFALARTPAVALAASVVAGVSWIAVLATINVSAQLALPAWVRGRGLSIYSTVMFGGLTLGSFIWGKVAGFAGLPVAHLLAAALLLLGTFLLRRWKLQSGAMVDLMPSMHWPAPLVSSDVAAERGPVLVTVEYRIDAADRDGFLHAIALLAPERQRDGAFAWTLFEDAAQAGRFVETFLLDSWLEHLRQHERVTQADRLLQDAVNRFHRDAAPQVTHLLAVD